MWSRSLKYAGGGGRRGARERGREGGRGRQGEAEHFKRSNLATR